MGSRTGHRGETMGKLVVEHGSSRLGNQMIRYMNALAIGAQCDDLDLYAYDMPEWGLAKPLRVGFPFAPLLLRGQSCPFEFAVRLARAGLVNSMQLAAIRMDTNWLLPVEKAREVFVAATEADLAGYDDGHLVVNVRGGEILDGKHKHYGPIPITYYDRLVEETGLTPVFMGQIGDDYYGSLLKSRYPGAIIHTSKGPMGDFQTIRNSKNIVVSISTFSWMAAWLSRADRIFMPLLGLFNPQQRPDVALTPLDDPRFIYDLFPVRNWRATPDRVAGLTTTTDYRRIGRDELATLLGRARLTTLPLRVRKHLQMLVYLAIHLQGRAMR